jgi:MtaA/CmuA family methyltransferase
MNGLQRVERLLAGEPVDRLPILPIVHTGLAPLFDVPLGEFFTRAETMAGVIVRGYREFGYDGVQLSLGVTGEAEALGARVDQPPDGSPVLKTSLLTDLGNLDALEHQDPTRGGRMPLFADAVRGVMSEIGREAFVLVTLRGPLLTGAQLRGVEEMLIDMLRHPVVVDRVLAFTTNVALRLGEWLLASGAHGLMLGEATCSPSFISPAMYRRFVLPCHRRLVGGLKRAGWKMVGMHICGQTTAIIGDITSTGVDLMDVDYQVLPGEALDLAQGKMVLRGNLDPSAVFCFGTPDQVRRETERLCRAVGRARWIVSSGCDIPPGTPAGNLAAFVRAAVG